MKLGQVKDASATVLFGVAFMTVLNKNVSKKFILAGLGLGAIIDGLFTLNTSWHCEEWRDAPLGPKYLILIQNLFIGGLAITSTP